MVHKGTGKRLRRHTAIIRAQKDYEKNDAGCAQWLTDPKYRAAQQRRERPQTTREED